LEESPRLVSLVRLFGDICSAVASATHLHNEGDAWKIVGSGPKDVNNEEQPGLVSDGT
jgi:hypothetical protein